MVRTIAGALDSGRRIPPVTRVVIRGAGEKAFCAGGDIRRIHDLGTAGQRRSPLAILARGIRAHMPNRALSEALCGADRRHRHGRRRRHVGAWQPPGALVSARFSPCRRWASASSPMSARPTCCRACPARPDLAGTHWRPHQDRRRAGARPCDARSPERGDGRCPGDAGGR